MKRIPLRARNGSVRAYALVDDGDYAWLDQWRWCLQGDGHAMRREYLGGGASEARYRTILMHRLILNFPPSRIDHIDRNMLNNQRANLRLVSNAQNAQNRRGANANSRSGIRGVYRQGNRWIASATLNYQRHHIGCFGSKEEAEAAVVAWRAIHHPYA